MKRHLGSKQKPVPNLPSRPRSAVKTVIGRTVSSKVSLCATAEGRKEVGWPSDISWPDAATDAHEHAIRIVIIFRRSIRHHRRWQNQPRLCFAPTSPKPLAEHKGLNNYQKGSSTRMKQTNNRCGTRVPNWGSKTAVRRGDTLLVALQRPS